jgi:hypothetical protein
VQTGTDFQVLSLPFLAQAERREDETGINPARPDFNRSSSCRFDAP